MNYNVKTLPTFEKELKRLVKKYPSLKFEFIELVKKLKQKPDQGVSMGNNCFKIRLAISSKGKGKSGGARILTYIQLIKKEVFLLTIYDKNEQENILDKELKDLLKSIPLQ